MCSIDKETHQDIAVYQDDCVLWSCPVGKGGGVVPNTQFMYEILNM